MKHVNVVFAAMAFVGLAALIAPRWTIIQRDRFYQRRRAARDRRGIDAYFEERRQLDAYAPTTSVWKTRLGGAALFLLASLAFTTNFLSTR